ncbi:M48 family metallopeptidase [Mobilitalea sibirica]|uniref:M48 family metallopeptidase n=1 Tax=Mobilitalea sibirica TaxID=1462919 RepID=A0A8J7HC54_9FIRM|nr:SprT family zinc-dependent metalloprotease [Mobilitalea sibirica]MBH1941786.1 M48 family metallopeptidase [Mobilitalea sibirica]
MKHLTINNIPIEIERKKIKNMYLRILPPDGRIHISVPNKIPEEAIKNFVISKRDWIKKQQQRIKQRQEMLPERSDPDYVSGEEVFLWGRKYLLQIRYDERYNQVELRDNDLIIMVKDNEKDCTTLQRRKLLNEYYRKALNREIPPLMEKWQAVIGVQAKEWRIRDMKTRWGTCNIRDKRIWLSLNLAKKPLDCLEYVVVHELVHLLEKSHNHVFKAYMNQYLPQWRLLKFTLNQ